MTKPIRITPQGIKLMNGYRLIYIPGYPKIGFTKDNTDWYYEHIYLMELELDRFMLDGEHVHHLDGNRQNNILSNLIVLSKAHHGRIHYWIDNGKNYSSCIEAVPTCKMCQLTLQRDQTDTCSIACNLAFRNINSKISPKESLEILIKSHPFTTIGKMFGVSDNAVRKWCKKYDLPYKKRARI